MSTDMRIEACRTGNQRSGVSRCDRGRVERRDDQRSRRTRRSRSDARQDGGCSSARHHGGPIRWRTQGYDGVSGRRPIHREWIATRTYTVTAQLTNDLALITEPRPIVEVRSGGCASVRVGVVPNGRIHGIMKTVDGHPVRFQSVALMRGPLADGPDGYVEQVDTDADGRFAIIGVRPGVYALGRLSSNVDGVVFPSVLPRHAR